MCLLHFSVALTSNLLLKTKDNHLTKEIKIVIKKKDVKCMSYCVL